ncbi:methyltransferase domain-containing protein [Clostridium sp. MSJ-11]|uniref:Methyltransferase domain-containing protein n=1 Tax=Clostridium mobile TaxID=2841512 RepID=A0ABS6EDL0_9CLOT|nr:methyltransferase domain-containing protein [Clostridium mobile]MBU5483287.1 methyltransferase domain-containing protein [Clostridium mobile]
MYINKVKKKHRASELIRKNQEKFKCPVCSEPMYLNNFYSLTCSSNHCFDISRKGYLNLLTSAYSIVYSKELFEARHKVCDKKFYDPLIDEISKIIHKYKRSTGGEKELDILDAGCGEGSHLYSLSQRISGDLKCNMFGADISKEGINIASNNSSDIIWTVADLTRLPFENRSFDVILNILSPANYLEFERILADEGIIIKVVPGQLYLKELREAIYKNKNYSNDKVVDYFTSKLEVVYVQNINYTFSIDEELLPFLIKMTPLTWGENIKGINSSHEIDISSITLDLTILVGKRK